MSPKKACAAEFPNPAAQRLFRITQLPMEV